MKSLPYILSWAGKRKGQIFVLLALLLLGASIFTFGAPKAHASGGACVCFFHTSANGNTFGDYTLINDSPYSLTSQSVIFVTHNWGTNGIYNDHPLGVRYIGGYWAIFNEDQVSMPVGLVFNVWTGATGTEQVATATTTNTFGDYTTITGNFDSSSRLIVTPTWGTNGNGVYDPHPIGVWYTGSQWAIFNEDSTAMPVGASFNVLASSLGTVVSTPGSNAFGDYVFINVPGISNVLGELIMVTPNWGTNGIYNPHPIGVWFTGSQWAVFNEDETPIPAGVTFNIL